MGTTTDLWNDRLMNIFFWMGCIGFGWVVGLTLGLIV